MSSDEAADDAEDLEHVRFILMPASETGDGQDRVMSRAAYDLQVPCYGTLRFLRTGVL